MHTLLPGTLIDERYQVVQLLGEGGMGAVYSAIDLGLKRTVAIKFLGDAFHRNRLSPRFQNEAKVLSTLSHPGIAVFYHFGSWQNAPYIAMEYVEGRTLQDVLTEGNLGVGAAIAFTMQICKALKHAHDRAIIHRDLKPANIMICNDGNIKIIDFGLAKALQEEQKFTQTGEMLGTPIYMSPEQWLGKPADHRTDIYSVGCILYECCRGEPIFSGQNPVELQTKHLNSNLDDILARLPSTAPPGLEGVLERALAKGVEDRYQNSDQMMNDLLLIGTDSAPTRLVSSNKKTLANAQFIMIAVIAFAIGITAFSAPRLLDRGAESKSLLKRSESSIATIPAVLLIDRNDLQNYCPTAISRIEYYQNWLRKNGTKCSKPVMLAHLYMSSDYYERFPFDDESILEIERAMACFDSLQNLSKTELVALRKDMYNRTTYVAALARKRADYSTEIRMLKIAASNAAIINEEAPINTNDLLALALNNSGRYSEAEQYARTALKLANNQHFKPLDKVPILIRLSMSLFGSGRIQEAELVLRQSAAVATNNAARQQVAETYFQECLPEQTLAMLSKITASEPRFKEDSFIVDVSRAQANALTALRAFAKARAAYAKSMDHCIDTTYWRIFGMMSANGAPSQLHLDVAEIFRKRLERQPNRAEAIQGSLNGYYFARAMDNNELSGQILAEQARIAIDTKQDQWSGEMQSSALSTVLHLRNTGKLVQARELFEICHSRLAWIAKSDAGAKLNDYLMHAKLLGDRKNFHEAEDLLHKAAELAAQQAYRPIALITKLEAARLAMLSGNKEKAADLAMTAETSISNYDLPLGLDPEEIMEYAAVSREIGNTTLAKRLAEKEHQFATRKKLELQGLRLDAIGKRKSSRFAQEQRNCRTHDDTNHPDRFLTDTCEFTN